jgi:hypothetical protein
MSNLPITITSTCPTNHCLIHETRSTLICMQLMPRSPRAYLKPYAQHHQHMPLPSMYQDHHIPSQDMCLNQVPTCTMHQPCIPQPIPSTMYHNKCINHAPCTNHVSSPPVPYHVPTMHINHVHQHLYHTMYQANKPRNVPTMYLNK